MQYEEWQHESFAAELERQGIRPEKFALMLETEGYIRGAYTVQLWANGPERKQSMPQDKPLREAVARLLGVPYERLVRSVEGVEEEVTEGA